MNTRKRKKEMLISLRNEITSLERTIDNPKLANLKIKGIKNLKLSIVFAKYIMPVVLVSTIVTATFGITDNSPFFRDSKKKSMKYKKDIDNLGNINIEEQTNKYEDDTSILIHYCKWNLDIEGYYYRKVITYDLTNINEDKVKKLLDSNTNYFAYEDILGFPLRVSIEKKNTITEEELNEKDYVIATIFGIDKGGSFTIKETSDNNLGTTILWMAVLLVSEMITFHFRSEHFDLNDRIKEVSKNYKLLDSNDIEVLKKKLEIKKATYNKLVR